MPSALLMPLTIRIPTATPYPTLQGNHYSGFFHLILVLPILELRVKGIILLALTSFVWHNVFEVYRMVLTVWSVVLKL